MPYISRTILLCEYVWTIINVIKYYYTNKTHLDMTAHLDHGKTTEVHTYSSGENTKTLLEMYWYVCKPKQSNIKRYMLYFSISVMLCDISLGYSCCHKNMPPWHVLTDNRCRWQVYSQQKMPMATFSQLYMCMNKTN